MNDLKRMERFYNKRNKNEWSSFSCYSFFLGCNQRYIINKILSKIDIIDSTFLDIGAGEGNFILNLISLGINAKNITAIEYLEDRYLKLKEKLPHIISINDDFLKIDLVNKYDVITILAVLTSITDNDI